MDSNSKSLSREYRKLGIQGATLIRSRRYVSVPEGWLKEDTDFVELTGFLGFKFDVRSMFTMWSPKGVVRGGHMEHRSRILTVSRGTSFVVLVDVRQGENQGKVETFMLGRNEAAWGDSVVVPEGLIVAYVPLSDKNLMTVVANKPFNRFDSMMTLDVSDPELKINWPEEVMPQSLEEEKKLLSLKEFIKQQ